MNDHNYAVWMVFDGDPSPIKAMFTMDEMETARMRALHNWRKMPRLNKSNKKIKK
jgi:hypothetical protein